MFQNFRRLARGKTITTPKLLWPVNFFYKKHIPILIENQIGDRHPINPDYFFLVDSQHYWTEYHPVNVISVMINSGFFYFHIPACKYELFEFFTEVDVRSRKDNSGSDWLMIYWPLLCNLLCWFRFCFWIGSYCSMGFFVHGFNLSTTTNQWVNN